MKSIEISELCELIYRYDDYFGPLGQNELMSCLKDLQKAYGFIPKMSYPYLEKHFNSNANIIHSLIKRLPSLVLEGGPHTLAMCSGQRCMDKNQARFIQEVQTLLNIKTGETSQDGRFELKIQACMNRCALGRNINIDNDPYTHMDIEKLKTILLKYRD